MTELDRRELAFKRLAHFYLEHGGGPLGLREHVIRTIWDSPLAVLQECGRVLEEWRGRFRLDLSRLRFVRRDELGAAIFSDPAGLEIAISASGTQSERAEAVRALVRAINRACPVEKPE